MAKYPKLVQLELQFKLQPTNNKEGVKENALTGLGFMFAVVGKPVATETSAKLTIVCPAKEVKLPPTNILDEFKTRAPIPTPPLRTGFGFHEVDEAVARDISAKPLRATPPTVAKSPPTYIEDAPKAREET